MAKLNYLADSYCGSHVDWSDFSMHRECFQAIKSLCSNTDILITKPDKGSGVVILNDTDYVEKMKTILNDGNKFVRLGPVEDYDNTMKSESKLQKCLLQLRKVDQLTRSKYSNIVRFYLNKIFSTLVEPSSDTAVA